MDFFNKYTPVPLRGSSMHPSELRYPRENLRNDLRPAKEARRAEQGRTVEKTRASRRVVIDLTGDDDDIMVPPSFAFAFRPKPASSPQPSPALSATLPQEAHGLLQAHPALGQTNSPSSTASAKPNKRKEFPSGKENDEDTWNPKRLRARKLREDQPLPSVEVDEDDDEGTYEVEQVLASRRGRGCTEYLLAWVGYLEVTWRPEAACDCDELIKEFRAAPQLHFHSESAEANALENDRRRRQQNAADTNAPKPPKVKPAYRDPKTGRFAKRPRFPSVIPDSEDEGDDFRGIYDGQQAGNLVPANNPSAQGQETSMLRAQKLKAGYSDTPNRSTHRLHSRSPSSSVQNVGPYAAEVWIHVRATPIDNGRVPSCPPADISNHSARPKQTAQVNWTVESPDRGPHPPAPNGAQPSSGFAAIAPETTKIALVRPSASRPAIISTFSKSTNVQSLSSTPGEASGCPPARPFSRLPIPQAPATATGTKFSTAEPAPCLRPPVQTSLARTEGSVPPNPLFALAIEKNSVLQHPKVAVVEGVHADSGFRILLARDDRRDIGLWHGAPEATSSSSDFEFGADPNVDPELAWALKLSMEEEKARMAALPHMPPQIVPLWNALNHQGHNKKRQEQSHVLRQVSQGRAGINNRHSGRSSIERRTAKERHLTTAAMEAELIDGLGYFENSRKKVTDLFVNASAEASRRAPPPSAHFTADRYRSESLATEAFRAELGQIQLEKRDRGVVRSELRGGMGPAYAKDLLERARTLPEA